MAAALLRWLRRGSRGRDLRFRSKRLPLCFEPLEDRTLLSVTLVELETLVAADAAAGDFFGWSVAIDGDTAVVGSPSDDDAGSASGSAYVFVRNDNGTPLDPSDDTWNQQAKLTASDAAAGDVFGISVSISGDTIVVGAHGNDDAGSMSGSAYVFRQSGNNWVQEAKLVASDAAAGDFFGTSVAISGDTVVVGAQFDADAGALSGSAYVFQRTGNNWVQVAKLLASDGAAGDFFGRNVAIDGNTIVVGASGNDDAGSNSGSAYIFIGNDGGTPADPSDDTWVQQAKIVAGDAAAEDFFGSSVAISGDTVVVGALGDDDVAFGAGAAYVFVRKDNGTPSDPSDDTWAQQAKLTASAVGFGNSFGSSVAIDGDTIVVGALFEDSVAVNSGAAYVFQRDGTTWTLAAKQKANNPTDAAQFGRSVSISGDTFIAGASFGDNAGTATGTAYVYFIGPDITPPVVESVDVGGDLKSLIVQLNDDDLDPVLATNSANYRVTAANGDANGDADPFNDGDEVDLAISSVAYDPATDRITIQLTDVLFEDIFRLRIDGDDGSSDGTPGLTDLAGNFLSGGDFATDLDLTSLSLIDDLLTTLEGLGLSTGAENSLTARLEAAVELLGMDVGSNAGVLALLDAFVRGVNQWFDRGEISLEDRDALIADVDLIILGLTLTG